MHVLIYSDDPGIGGVAQFDHMFSLGLRARGHRVGLVQTAQPNPRADERIAAGVEHHWLDYDTVADFARTLNRVDEATDLLRRIQPDVILFSDSCPVSNFAGKQAAAALGIPYAARVGFVAPYLAERFAPVLDRLETLYRNALAVVAVSQENLNLMRVLFRLPEERGRLIYSGKGPAFFARGDADQRRARRASAGAGDDDVVCFTAARLERVKGYQHQLAAIERLRGDPSWNRLRFVWAGPGGMLEEIEQTLAARGLTDKVKLLGQCWEIPEWLDAADVFVLPAHAEGLPQAVIEAMAKRLPVVSTRVSGIPEALGDTGVLLPDPAADPQGVEAGLAQAISTLAADPDRRRRLGEACFARADRMFHADRMVSDYFDLLATGVDRRRAAATGDIVATVAARATAGFRPRAAEPADTSLIACLRRLESDYAASADAAGPAGGDERALHLILRRLRPRRTFIIGGATGPLVGAVATALSAEGVGEALIFDAAEIDGAPLATALRCALPAGATCDRLRSVPGDPRREAPAFIAAAPPDFVVLSPGLDETMTEWAVRALAPTVDGMIFAGGVVDADGVAGSDGALSLLSWAQHGGAPFVSLAGATTGATGLLLLVRRDPANADAPAAAQRVAAGAGGDRRFPLTSKRLYPGWSAGDDWGSPIAPADRYAALMQAGKVEPGRPGLAELLFAAATARSAPTAIPSALLQAWTARAWELDQYGVAALADILRSAGRRDLLTTLAGAKRPPPANPALARRLAELFAAA
jgi:glycosyltransferase involved in cell wall biosynthesis